MHPSTTLRVEGDRASTFIYLFICLASDGCRVRKNGCHSMQPPVSPPSHTAAEPVGDGPRGRCYRPVNPIAIGWQQGGKGVKYRRSGRLAIKRGVYT